MKTMLITLRSTAANAARKKILGSAEKSSLLVSKSSGAARLPSSMMMSHILASGVSCRTRGRPSQSRSSALVLRSASMKL